MSDGNARIRKVRQPDRWVRVIQDTVRDEGLSLRALGLLTYLLSLPDDWHVSADRIAGTRKEGREAVRATMRELEAAGYVRRVKEQDERGRWTTTVYVHEVPAGKPTPENPTLGESGVNRTTETNDRKHSATPPAPKGRPRDLLFDAVCEVSGIDPSSVPRAQASDIGKTVRDLREVDATPEQVRQARREWTRRFPGATFTHRVLRQHWATLAAAPVAPADPDLDGILPL